MFNTLKSILIASLPGILGATIPLVLFWDQNHVKHAFLTITGLIIGHIISVFFLIRAKEIVPEGDAVKENKGSSTSLTFRVYISYIFSIIISCGYCLNDDDLNLRGLFEEGNFNSMNDILLLSLPIHGFLTAIGKWWRNIEDDKSDGFFSSFFKNLGYYLGIYLMLLLTVFVVDWFVSDIIGFELVNPEIESLIFTCILLFSGLIFSLLYDETF